MCLHGVGVECPPLLNNKLPFQWQHHFKTGRGGGKEKRGKDRKKKGRKERREGEREKRREGGKEDGSNPQFYSMLLKKHLSQNRF